MMGVEIFVPALVNELYCRRAAPPDALDEGRQRLRAKVGRLQRFLAEPPCRHPFHFSDFGLRRSFSGVRQCELLTTLTRELPDRFPGASDVLLAGDLGPGAGGHAGA